MSDSTAGAQLSKRKPYAYGEWVVRNRWWVILASLFSVAAIGYGLSQVNISRDGCAGGGALLVQHGWLGFADHDRGTGAWFLRARHLGLPAQLARGLAQFYHYHGGADREFPVPADLADLLGPQGQAH